MCGAGRKLNLYEGDNMINKEALETLDRIEKTVLEKYSDYQQLTISIFDIMKDMLSVDYQQIIPRGKRIKVLKDYIKTIFTDAFNGNGHKNYMQDILGALLEADVDEYILRSLGNMSDEYAAIITRLKYELIYWQGYESCKWRKLEEIEKIIDGKC